MDFTNNLYSINLLAVFGATLAANLLGGIWYAPFMFGRAWAKANDIQLSTSGIQNVPGTFIASFVMQLLAASMLAWLLGPSATAMDGLQMGGIISICFVFTTQGVTNLFERRPFHLIAINSGFHIVSFLLMGLIIGIWG